LVSIPYQSRRNHNHNQKARIQQDPKISSSSLDIFLDKPFWIWDQQQHGEEFIKTDGNCRFNHIIGLHVKNEKEYPIFDYQKLIYDAFLWMSNMKPFLLISLLIITVVLSFLVLNVNVIIVNNTDFSVDVLDNWAYLAPVPL
jgi:hypothetical protein